MNLYISSTMCRWKPSFGLQVTYHTIEITKTLFYTTRSSSEESPIGISTHACDKENVRVYNTGDGSYVLDNLLVN